MHTTIEGIRNEGKTTRISTRDTARRGRGTILAVKEKIKMTSRYSNKFNRPKNQLSSCDYSRNWKSVKIIFTKREWRVHNIHTHTSGTFVKRYGGLVLYWSEIRYQHWHCLPDVACLITGQIRFLPGPRLYSRVPSQDGWPLNGAIYLPTCGSSETDSMIRRTVHVARKVIVLN